MLPEDAAVLVPDRARRSPPGVLIVVGSGGQAWGRVARERGVHHVHGEKTLAAMEATQGQIDGFFSQLPYKCHLEEVASVGD